MVRWKADRARVVGDLVQPQRLGVCDQGAEDPAPARQLADLLRLHPVDSRVDEALEALATLVDHAKGRVPGAGQGGCRLGQLQQQRIERQLRAERNAGLDEAAEALTVRGPGHGGIIRWPRTNLPPPLRVLVSVGAGFATVTQEEGVTVTSGDVNGFTLAELQFPPGYVQEAFEPDSSYLALVLDGAMEKTFRRRSLSFDKGSALTMPAGTRHSARFSSRGARIVIVKPRGASSSARAARRAPG